MVEKFDVIKKNLDEFDNTILESWELTVLTSTSTTIDSYVEDIPNFPAEKSALIPQPNDNLTLERIAFEPDPGEAVDFHIPIETMQKKFNFSAEPVERPRLVKKKKKKTKKKRNHSSTHRSESMANLSSHR